MIKKLEKMPKRKVTVDEILHCDEITELLQEVHSKRAEIDQFFLGYADQEGVPHFWWHGTKERMLWVLENAKMKLLNEEEEDSTW